VSDPLALDEAVRALRLDPNRAVLVRVDDLTVEMRVASTSGATQPVASSVPASELLHDLGPWEGESTEELDALFTSVRQKSNRAVPDLDR
jgi:hypothetical protein